MPLRFMTRGRSAAGFSAAALLLTLSACSSGSPAATAPSTAAAGLPSSHVHGLSVNPQTDQVLLATHEGLFDVTKQPKSPATQIGDTNDLMGFTAAADQGVFYASGHPGPGSDLPNPMGLIRSADGGKTWEQLSRQGESDFHALATAKSGIVAYDGTLQTSPDGKTWTTATAGFVPAVLAGNPETDTVLATTREGLQRSTDGGKTWALNTAAPIIQFVAYASGTEVFGVEPDGAVHHSTDAGSTWTQTGSIKGQVQAITAVKKPDGKPTIWAATTEGLVVSTDGGNLFRTPPGA
ncbi:BNR/Asp-box repeat family protein [Pseudarthrobacter siccitolerans]|uniref:BNR/Asp-box repeat family protein n=1 Tax=Pseudarthrobacter siccitolerans TaxID=861266 RepID=A0A024H721_9MICC|nr:exo-alpha-sialidase [Pseudarthrobacter siccitolerans]CCQ47521.1 BNR/Asp-box repeat family protein [Pseudarthrobacter siccitolerans]